jgi:hypothetical protein
MIQAPRPYPAYGHNQATSRVYHSIDAVFRQQPSFG